MGRAPRPVSAINDPVWRYCLIAAGAGVLAVVLHRLLGPTSALGTWLVALILGLGWLAAVRMLVLDTKWRRLWLGLLAVSLLSLVWGGLVFAMLLGTAFLLFRRYRPMRHLSSVRRAKMFGLALVSLPLLIVGISLAEDFTGFANFGKNLGVYALFCLRLFWGLLLVHLAVRARLHFLRLKPKLAVSGALIALVPVVLVVTLGGLMIYGVMGEQNATRGRLVLHDWVRLVDEDPSIGNSLLGSAYVYPEPAAQEGPTGGENAPWWLASFIATVQRDNPSGGWTPADTTALFAIDQDEVWLIRLRLKDQLQLWSFPVNSLGLDRLASILHADVALVHTENATITGTAGANDAEVEGGVTSNSTVVGRYLDESAGGGLLHRSLYYGATTLTTISFEAGELNQETLLLTTRTRLATLGSELVSSDNDLGQALVLVLGLIALLFLLVEVFSLFFGLRIATGITSAVRVLHHGTEELAKGNLDVRINVPNEDEFGDLADSFNEMTTAVKRGREELLARERLERELNTAREIQQRLLPFALPELTGFTIAGISEPSRQVGGDYYDFLRLPNGSLGVAVGDVSGKGIPAALLMANLQASLKGQVIHPSGVGEMVSKVNDLLVDSTDPNMFVTFFYGVLDTQTASFTATNAGHDPPILCRADGSVQRIATGGLLMGVMGGVTYEETTVTLEPGDVLVLYTDGITEAIGPALLTDGEQTKAVDGKGDTSADGETDEDDDINLFSVERLVQVIQKCRDLNAEDIKQQILDAVATHTAGIAQSDDITLVVIKREFA